MSVADFPVLGALRKVDDPSVVASDAAAPSASRRPMRLLQAATILVSGTAHAGALALVLGTGPAGTDAGRPADTALPQAQVTLISQVAFDAMVAPQPWVDASSPDAPPPAADEAPDEFAPPFAVSAAQAPDIRPVGATPAPVPPGAVDTPPPPMLSPPPLGFLSSPAALADLPLSGTEVATAPRPAPPPTLNAAPPMPASAFVELPPAPESKPPVRYGAQPPARPTLKPPKAKAASPAATPAAPSTVAAAASAPPAGLSGRAIKTAIADWGGRLRARIERAKSYPAGSRAAGKVRLVLTVAPSGQVLSARVAGGSGDPALDRAAVAAVTRTGRMPKAPKGLAEASYTFTVTVSFAP